MNLLTFPIRVMSLCLLLYFHSTTRTYGQNTLGDDVDINAFIQELLPVMAEEGNPEELFEFFSQLLADPLDLNLIGEEHLVSLLVLSPTQIKAFLRYREVSGPFLSMYELQAIPEWDLGTIKRVLPFLTLGNASASLSKTFGNATQNFLLTRFRRVLQTQKGFTTPEPGSRSITRYAGNPWQWYTRYRYARTGAYSIGLTLEKDAGEIWNWAPQRQIYGMDFTSFHFQLQNRKRLKNLIIGDYQVQAGQGLVLSSGFSIGKGSEVIQSTYRSTLGARPYTSVMEHGFYRGLALTYQFNPKWQLTSFYSHKNRDGTLAETGVDFNTIVITSLPTDGYHRTPNERSKHGNIVEKNAGAHLFYQPKKGPFNAGFTILRTEYSKPIEKRNLPYNRYDFKGTTNTIFGLHASYRTRNTHFFTESARSSSGGIGHLSGAIWALNKYWDISMLARFYPRNFHTFYGKPFSEGSRPYNEYGIYSGIRYSPSKKWRHSAYIDFFHFPWKRYLVDTTSNGLGFLVHSHWRPNRNFKAHAVIQSEQKQRNDSPIPIRLATTRRTTALINFEWSFQRRYVFRTRIQGARYRFGSLPPSDGFTIVQDATFRFEKLELGGRLALFRTDDYDSRQYVYERDVLYSFSFPAYYHHGIRHYLLFRFDATRRLRLWVRWSQTHYSNQEKIGSGLDEIIGNARSELKFQAMYRF